MARLFLDCDGVVADWRAGVESLLGEKIKDGVMIPDRQWRKIRDCQRFFRTLPVLEGGYELVDYSRRLLEDGLITDLAFLTAIPGGNDMPWAFSDKVDWVREHFPEIPVFFGPYSKDKFHHCQPGDILIDDRKDNCASWNTVGGLAHRYRCWEDCRDWFKEIGL